MRRLPALSSSPHHGLNFCQGTVAEMFRDPERFMAFALGVTRGLSQAAGVWSTPLC